MTCFGEDLSRPQIPESIHCADTCFMISAANGFANLPNIAAIYGVEDRALGRCLYFCDYQVKTSSSTTGAGESRV